MDTVFSVNINVFYKSDYKRLMKEPIEKVRHFVISFRIKYIYNNIVKLLTSSCSLQMF